MAQDENELAEAQAKLLAKRGALGISEDASPNEAQSQSAEPDPLANLNEPAKRFVDELPDAERERLRNNLTNGKLESTEHVGSIASELVKKYTAKARARAAAAEEIGDTARPILSKRPEANHGAESASEIHAALIALSLRRKKDHHARIPRDLIATPQFNSLNAIECRTLAAVLLYCGRKDGIARPGRASLLKRLGMPDTDNNKAQLKRGISGLKSHGILWTKAPGYPGHAAEYFVARNQQQIDFILSLNGGQGVSPKMEDKDRPPLGDFQ